MFSGKACEYFSPMDDFARVDYMVDMADRLWDYQQMCDEYSDGNWWLSWNNWYKLTCKGRLTCENHGVIG